ncbi:MAG TPA: DUF3237 family protein [Burkholderiaceae bacterium]|jgi:hypothetical protein
MHATTSKPAVLRKALQIEVIVAAPITLGELGGMERRMVPIVGGKLTGPDFSGAILPGGSDVQAVRPDGTIELLARYAVDLGAHGKLLIENTGIRRMAKSGEVEAAPYFRGVMRFCAPPGALQWLNDSVFLSDGYRDGNTVYLTVMEVL